jgi:hypothetical protein
MEATDMQDLPGRFVLSHVSFSARVATILKPDCHIAMHLARLRARFLRGLQGCNNSMQPNGESPGRTRGPGHAALHA